MPVQIAMVSSYDYLHPGGVGEHVRSLSAALRRRGHEVVVLAPGSPAETQGIRDYVRTGRSHAVPGNGSVAHVGLAPRLSTEARRLLRTTRFDIVHYHEPLLPMVPMLVLRAHRGANVGTFHSSAERSPAYRCGRPLLMATFRRLHMCIAVSEPARDFAARYFPGDYRIVPNGVDTTRFHPRPTPGDGLRAGTSTILFVGRIDRRKGLPTLLEAFLMLRRERDDARLVIAGDGPRRAACERYVLRHAVPDVTFAGFVGAQALPGYYAAADVFCAPSTGQESFGIVLLEAMASGLPIIASAIPGYSRIVTHGRHGLLLPPKDPSALARGLAVLLDDPVARRRMGRAGVVDARRYDWDVIAGEILEVYAEARERHRRGILAADAYRSVATPVDRPA